MGMGAISAGVDVAASSASPIVGVMYVMQVAEADCCSPPGSAVAGLGLSR